ncbi:MAG: hypothetical protein AB7N24_13940 [Dehalococcoidia bacterium]
MAVADTLLTTIEQGGSLSGLLQFVDRACTTTPDPIGGPLKCPPGVPNGTMLPAVVVASCEGHWYTSDDPAVGTFNSIGSDYYLYALATYPPPLETAPIAGVQYSLYLIKGTGPLDWVRLWLGDQGVVGSSHCEASPGAAFARETEVLVAPGQSAPLPPASGEGLHQSAPMAFSSRVASVHVAAGTALVSIATIAGAVTWFGRRKAPSDRR